MKISKKKEKKLFLKFLWDAWKRAGIFLAKVNLYIVTFLIYWSVFAVTALIIKLMRKDFLAIGQQAKEESYWTPLPSPDNSLERYYKQF